MKIHPASLVAAFLVFVIAAANAGAAEFDITDYGASADDDGDDTGAINAALQACGEAGGGTVIVPAGTFLVSRQGSESPILEIPSNTTVRGAGDGSILKFAAGVNDSNFWRMIGASQDCHDITIRDLHLDGSNTHQRYVKGETPEQNHGIFFYNRGGRIENVTIRDCLVENFSGDCVSFSQGCRGFTVRNVRVRNFIRQGIQMGGGKGDGGHYVTGCRDLPHTVEPGGSTIHVEHAEGASDFRIIGNECRHHLLAGGGADRLVVEDNDVQGRIEGNSIRNGRFENNRLQAGDLGRTLMQFGYADGLVIRGNRIAGDNAKATGIYVWGASRYNATPSRNITIEENVFELKGQPVLLNGVEGAKVSGNVIRGSKSDSVVVERRTENVTVAGNRIE
ncbi:Pectate lyase superfamily protein [Maioricimonas rarisocia]|uniref:Pectate lyase superfamily protein n=1 Tax=Maioricimonas rarisocia TaxID=2528026 RepID=A0A517Z4W2_9PLAN|nr:glycosyl hydrolase family 28-related protein [Maioricimonas rarisocia]QDU37520.1 Pectate lyase superfamily protein [Maioricimonas rarisocia]